jgi:hypothetical protein
LGQRFKPPQATFNNKKSEKGECYASSGKYTQRVASMTVGVKPRVFIRDKLFETQMGLRHFQN